jgi:hypothetical protein
MKNFMKKKIRRAMESWPRRKPCVKERLWVLAGSFERRLRGKRAMSLEEQAAMTATAMKASAPLCKIFRRAQSHMVVILRC